MWQITLMAPSHDPYILWRYHILTVACNFCRFLNRFIVVFLSRIFLSIHICLAIVLPFHTFAFSCSLLCVLTHSYSLFLLTFPVPTCDILPNSIRQHCNHCNHWPEQSHHCPPLIGNYRQLLTTVCDTYLHDNIWHCPTDRSKVLNSF